MTLVACAAACHNALTGLDGSTLRCDLREFYVFRPLYLRLAFALLSLLHDYFFLLLGAGSLADNCYIHLLGRTTYSVIHGSFSIVSAFSFFIFFHLVQVVLDSVGMILSEQVS